MQSYAFPGTIFYPNFFISHRNATLGVSPGRLTTLAIYCRLQIAEHSAQIVPGSILLVRFYAVLFQKDTATAPNNYFIFKELP